MCAEEQTLLAPVASLYDEGGVEPIEGNRLAFSPGGLLAVKGHGLDVWDLTRLDEPLCELGTTWGTSRPAWSPDGSKLAVGEWDDLSRVRIWSIPDGRCLRSYEGHRGYDMITSLAWSPDGARIASCSATPLLHVWDPATGDLLWATRPVVDPAPLVWTPDGACLAALAFSMRIVNLLRFPDLSMAVSVQQPQPLGWITCFAFAPQGDRLACGTENGYIQVWGLDRARGTGSPLLCFDRHMDAVSGLAWSPDGRLLLSGAADRHVYLWRADTGALVRYAGCRGEDNRVQDVAWSPDGRWLAVCEARGGVVRLYQSGAAPQSLPAS